MTRARIALLLMTIGFCARAFAAEAVDPLLDWSDWSKHRAAVAHPSLTIKPADLARAKENVRRYEWARKYSDEMRDKAAARLPRLTPAFIDHMIEPTTPGHVLFTPCPVCRDQGKPWHPHGQWDWSVEHPDRIQCRICKTIFPNDQYAETIQLHSTWGTPQTFGFCGGEPMEIFAYQFGRPSFSAFIRASKVQYMTDACKLLGEAYLLSGDERFAAATRSILLRFAQVYPNWLVHVGYGEFADMDPHIAALNIKHLPADELVYPPNKPDRALHTGYWTAGRAFGSGGEGRFIRQVCEAYDFTCSSQVYTDTDRRAIEEKLLLEGTVLLVADKQINNKSVANRSAAAMVGMCVGHPGLVRFGFEGFHKAVDEWFLPDGGTPESPSYAMMAFHGVSDFVLACRDYSDPPGYLDAAGNRLDHLNLYHSPAYARAWSAMIDGLRGDLTLPPYADTHIDRPIDPGVVELLAANYPERPHYLALLKELCGSALAGANASVAIYYREPGLEQKVSPALKLPDICLPDLRVGEMRSGDDGRESLLLLSASHWGGHHHLDSLNLYYWKNGRELLSDLGYLWDHPQKQMTTRTLAHNTVLIDEADQETANRGGEVEFFDTSAHVKVMRASSHAYPQARLYQRTSAIIDHGAGHNYVVDFFTVEGGATQDFVFHGPGQNFATADATFEPPKNPLYDLSNIRSASAGTTWKIDWKIDDSVVFTAWSLGQSGERAMIADGWGQRDYKNSDVGVTLPYIVRRCEGPGVKQFVSLFESHSAIQPFVRGVKRSVIDGGVALEVETAAGRDYIVCSDRFSASSQADGKQIWTFKHEQ